MGNLGIPGGISAAAPGALGTTMYGKRPATGGTMGGGQMIGGLRPGPQYDPMTPEGGAILDPNRPRGGLSAAPRFDPMTPEGGAILDPNRPRNRESDWSHTPDRGGGGYDGSGINPNGQFGPRPRRPGGPGYRRGPRSNQPGHGNGNGGQMQGMPRDARQLSNGDVVGRGDPRYWDTGNAGGNRMLTQPARLPLLNKTGVQGSVPPPEGGPVYTPGGANEEFLRGGGGGWA